MFTLRIPASAFRTRAPLPRKAGQPGLYMQVTLPAVILAVKYQLSNIKVTFRRAASYRYTCIYVFCIISRKF